MIYQEAHVEIPDPADLRELLRPRDGWCISIYFAVHPTWPESKADHLRFERLLEQTAAQLAALGMRTPVAKDLLKPAWRLLEDRAHWLHPGRCLALFIAEGMFKVYRLPQGVDDMAIVGRRFAVRPLLALLAEDSHFFVLALSKQEMRLLSCTRDSALELPLPKHPHSVSEATGFEVPQRGFAFHPSVRVGGSKRHAPVVHSVGVRPDDSKEDVLEYCQAIDRSLHGLLRDQQAPLVLAGVEYLLAIYAKANTYPHLVPATLPGSPQRMSAEDLRARAWPLVQESLQHNRTKWLARCRQSVGTGMASHDLPTIVRAAARGQIAVLFVAADVQAWGRHDAPTGHLELHTVRQDGDDDLLELATADTLEHHGSVFVLPPGQNIDGAPVAAVFRYPF